MSKTKRALPEDIDITSSNEVPVPAVNNTPDDTDIAVANLFNAVNRLELLSGGLYSYVDELSAIRERVDDLIRNTEMPF